MEMMNYVNNISIFYLLFSRDKYSPTVPNYLAALYDVDRTTSTTAYFMHDYSV